MKITTKSGFKFEVDERVFTDYRFVDAVAKSSADKISEIQGTTEMVNLLFGKNKQAFLDYIASKNDGFIPAEIVTEEVKHILEEYKDLKNSSSSEG